MRHQQATDEVLELAALYALGALDPQQAAAFEAHLAEGCRTCTEEVKSFAAVTGQLGHAASPERPAPEVRRRLFARLRAGAAEPAWTVVRSTEGEWETGNAPAMRIKRLFQDSLTNRFTALVRMEHGARYPNHEHA